MCNLLGYSKQAYYKQLKALESDSLEVYLIVGLVKTARIIWKRGSGRNLYAYLQESFRNHQIKIGRDKFFDILREHGLLIKPKRRITTTTLSYHRFYKYPNLIKEKVCNAPNQIWVSDITYIYLEEEQCFSYLFLITDVYSRKIIGYSLELSLKAIGAIKSLNQAIITSRHLTDHCIHHSDRGIQYCCNEYVKILNQHGISISMTEKGDPLENAIAERLNRTIKEEFTTQKELSFSNYKIAKNDIVSFVNFYNTKRPHSSIERLTPEEAYLRKGELKRQWKAYYKKKENGFS